MIKNVTVCFTIGSRPKLLRDTLLSMGALLQAPVLAVNDFGDQESNDVLSGLCPHSRLIPTAPRLGHHAAVDAMYREVLTPFIFHNEDDWHFSRTDFLSDALLLLEAIPQISMVCVRDTADIPMPGADRNRMSQTEHAGIVFQRLDHLHDQWHGFSFNPHLIRKTIWERLGGYAPFQKERHISRHLRKNGQFIAFLMPPACRHTGGDGQGTNYRPPSSLKRLKQWCRAHLR